MILSNLMTKIKNHYVKKKIITQIIHFLLNTVRTFLFYFQLKMTIFSVKGR